MTETLLKHNNFLPKSDIFTLIVKFLIGFCVKKIFAKKLFVGVLIIEILVNFKKTQKANCRMLKT
jgi:hypothetical protein